jgi:hypothetical protein
MIFLSLILWSCRLVRMHLPYYPPLPFQQDVTKRARPYFNNKFRIFVLRYIFLALSLYITKC